MLLTMMRTLCLLFVLVLLPVAAQTPTGQIVGVVRDSSGLAISGAQIAFQNEGTGEQRNCCVTDDTGAYLIRGLLVGRYTVAVEKPGFQRLVSSGISVSALENVRVDVTLPIGQTQQTVQVTAEAPQVETRSPTVYSLIEGARVNDLPLNGRNALSLTQLVPGVDRVNTANEGGFGQQAVSFNGLRTYSTNVQLDGTPMFYPHRGSTLLPPPPDAIQEVQVVTSGVTAEYGRGAAVISTVTKSGTNQFHGSLYEYLRNDAFDARQFFAQSKAKLRYNQFGGSAGGPVIRDKLFFFGSYQGLRIRREQLIADAFPPTAAERRGDFSGGSALPIDPQSGQPFPGGIIPSNRFDPVAVKLLERIPQPNTAVGNLSAVEPVPVTGNNYLGRIDYNIAATDRLSARYYLNKVGSRVPRPVTSGDSNNVPGYSPSESADDTTAITITHTRTWSPTLISTTRASLSRFVYLENNLVRTSMMDLGASNFSNGGGGPRLPKLEVAGRFIASPGKDNQRVGSTHDFAQDWSLNRGKHELKWGFSIQRNRFKLSDNGRSNGTFVFDGQFTRNGTTRFPVADFLLGSFSLIQQQSLTLIDGHYYLPAFYFQDNFRVTSRLTLNLGLRWEIYTPWREDRGQRTTFVPGVQSKTYPTAPVGLVYESDPEYPYKADWVNLGPRVGFAWDVFGNGRTSVRGGYGVSFDTVTGEDAVTTNQPYTFALSLANTGTLSNVYQTFQNPFPYVVDPKNASFRSPVTFTNTLSPNLHPSYIQNISLTIQQQIATDWVAQVGYISNLGRKLRMLVPQNLAPYIPGNDANGRPISTAQNIDQRRPLWPTFGGYSQLESIGNSAYHGLQTSFRKRMSKGFTVNGFYVFSKSIDECTNENQVCYLYNPFDRRSIRGRGDNDRRHSAVFSYLYELPFFRTGNPFLRQTLGGWQLSGINIFQSGTPFRSWLFRLGYDSSLTGAVLTFPDVIGDWRLPSNRSKGEKIAQWFNPAAFADPAPGTYGNMGKGVITTPGTLSWDLAVQKKFAIRENHALEFRSEFFNVMNHANLGEPDGFFINSRSFGRITSTRGDARIIQLALRYEF